MDSRRRHPIAASFTDGERKRFQGLLRLAAESPFAGERANAFAAATTYANCDASTTAPVLNVLDFTCFLNRFAAGCSGC